LGYGDLSMSVEIKAGWLYGTLPDDTGKEWPVSRSQQASSGSQNGTPVNLVLHTTETDHLVSTLQYPSNFQCGDGKIVQHIKLGESGDAVWTYDRDGIGIEMVGRSNLKLWLPQESTLGPTVALVAWLHETGRIVTGVERPRQWPLVLDKLPAAVVGYYRRSDPRALPGVYGHVDLNGGNSHWDPGSFDYTTFFARVNNTLNGGADEMAYADFKKGVRDAKAGTPVAQPNNEDYVFGHSMETRATSNPKPGAPAPHSHQYAGQTTVA
jgi:hypothetical protein